MTATTTTKPPTVRVAAVQAEPEWLDLPAAVRKTCSIIQDAARQGVQLIAFPECWIPGYPAWIWARPVDMERSVAYIRNSLGYDSPEMEQIRTCAMENAINVVLGFSENDHGSLYISQCLLTSRGELKIPRRKIKPTHMERTIFGDCTGDSLHNVADTDVGRVGALSCWEHANPLLKYHTYHQRELVHVAAWPPVYSHSGGAGLWSMSREGTRNLSQTYAVESSTFVLHSTSLILDKGIARMGTADGGLMNRLGGGAAAIYGPDGRQLTEDLPETDEGLVVADIDEDKVLETRCFLDPCGHYSRPDLLWLGVDSQAKEHVRHV
ncbi:Carbon-nitrogen hydrolase [Aspergillus melleus]|uniref:Carbon-nitrogen hydrolase n=1 Tax=Aspergillus melleus TaxID=138277 RepID=A0ACC3B727_9EURO|nr:Carbon-nitrogen hydrolase [Aspergillus melleus]